jgi:CubicO group peptidase (beta-lactamase class C family)
MIRSLWLMLLCIGTAHAQSADPKHDAVRAGMAKFVANGELAGATVVVGGKDGIKLLAHVGDADLASKRAMATDTIFRIASMTKPITAMAIMMLVDEGKLTVDDDVEMHLPEFKGQMLIETREKDKLTLVKPARPVKVRDLLTHTSGLSGNYGPGLADLYQKRHRTLAETTAIVSQRPLEFAPGSKWSYCNPGIDTLGRLIEVKSGMSYEAFLKARLFDPLGMKDTTCYPSAEQLARTATTYGKTEGKLVPAGNLLINYTPGVMHPVPAGGLFSTAADLAKLYTACLNKTAINGKPLISEKSFREMTRTQTGDIKTGFTEGMSYGYGFAVVVKPTGVTEALNPGTYGHGGAFGTQAWIDPVAGQYYLLLIQRTGLPNSDGSDIRREFQRLAKGALAN